MQSTSGSNKGSSRFDTGASASETVCVAIYFDKSSDDAWVDLRRCEAWADRQATPAPSGTVFPLKRWLVVRSYRISLPIAIARAVDLATTSAWRPFLLSLLLHLPIVLITEVCQPTGIRTKGKHPR